jgi:ASCH domain
MRALTVMQPWAWAVLQVGKDVENRPGPTSYRGPLLIHSSKRVDRAGLVRCAELAKIGSTEPFERLPRGVILGAVDLVDCSRDPGDLRRSPWAEPRAWHWWLANPRLLAAPVPARGALGLWHVPDDVADAVVFA